MVRWDSHSHLRVRHINFQEGGGVNATKVAACIFAVVLVLLLALVYWCRARNTFVMGVRA